MTPTLRGTDLACRRDASLDDDRTLKLPRYAAGIAGAWPIELGAETIERHTESHKHGTAALMPPTSRVRG